MYAFARTDTRDASALTSPCRKTPRKAALAVAGETGKAGGKATTNRPFRGDASPRNVPAMAVRSSPACTLTLPEA